MLNWAPLSGSTPKFWPRKFVYVGNYAQSDINSLLEMVSYEKSILHIQLTICIISSISKRYASRQSQAASSKCNGSGVMCFIKSISFMSEFKKTCLAQFDETATEQQYEILDERTLHFATLHYNSLHLSTFHFFPFKLHPTILHYTSLPSYLA